MAPELRHLLCAIPGQTETRGAGAGLWSEREEEMTDGFYILGAGIFFVLLTWYQHKQSSVGFGSLYFDRLRRPRLFLFIQVWNVLLALACIVMGVIKIVASRA